MSRLACSLAQGTSTPQWSLVPSPLSQRHHPFLCVHCKQTPVRQGLRWPCGFTSGTPGFSSAQLLPPGVRRGSTFLPCCVSHHCSQEPWVWSRELALSAFFSLPVILYFKDSQANWECPVNWVEAQSHLLWPLSPWKMLWAVSGKDTEPGPGWCGVHAAQSPVRPGVWTRHTGAEVGVVRRPPGSLGAGSEAGLSGGRWGLLHGTWWCKWWMGRWSSQGHESGQEVSARVPHGSRTGTAGVPVSCLSVLLRRMLPCRGPAMPSGALLWGTEPEEAWGAGRLPWTIPGASSVGPRPPRQTALSTRLGHCLEGAQTAS